MITSQPFGNTVDVGDLQGVYIKEFLEFATKPYKRRSFSDIYIPQLSGIQVVFNLTKPYGSRAQSIKVRCQQCSEPVFENLDLGKMYRIAIPSFITQGGDGFVAISDNLQNLKVGPLDLDVYQEYIRKMSPIDIGLEGRITIIGGENVTSNIIG